MNKASENNLDCHTAQSAQTIVKNTRAIKIKKNGKEEPIEASSLDNLTTKTLGILQENGVYATLLYLYSRSDKDRLIAKHIHKQLLRLTLLLLPSLKKEIADEIVAEDVMAETALNFLNQHISKDLDILLMAKQLWEQTLIYTRYGAKAWDVEVEAEKAREREEAERAKKAQEEVEKAKKAQEEAEKEKSET